MVGIFLLIVPEEEVSMSYESVSQASYSSKLLSSFFFPAVFLIFLLYLYNFVVDLLWTALSFLLLP